MGFYEDQVLPRAVDVVCGTGAISRLRAEVAAGLSGEVLEIGFGSGLNLPHLPPTVTRLLAVDPHVVGQRLAAPRMAESSVDVDVVGLDGQHLPLADASVDAALCTFTLCTIPDAHLALEEVRRVLRPGGALHLLEHGLSPDPRVARWQHRLTPLQRRVSGGCHLDRPIDRLLAEGGFELDSLDHPHMPGPAAFSYLYRVVARPA